MPALQSPFSSRENVIVGVLSVIVEPDAGLKLDGAGGASSKDQLRLLPPSVELVWAIAVPPLASEYETLTYDTAAVPLRVSPHLVGAELEARVSSCPEAPLKVSVPPEAIVWVAEAGKVRVSAVVTDLVRL